METTKIENPSLNWKAAIDELIKGRDLAARLGAMLKSAAVDRALVDSISGSFSRAIAALESGRDGFSARKRKMDCNRRRVIKAGVRKTVAAVNDGHSWRKYGQKVIHHSKFPRSYYRCTYKHDQKCLATRQVQQSEDDPSLFVITYFGRHTCRGSNDVASSLESEPCIIDFGSSAAGASAPFLGARPGHDEDVISNTHASGVTQMDALGESDSDRFVEELMGGVSELGDVTSMLHPSSPEHDELAWELIENISFFDFNK